MGISRSGLRFPSPALLVACLALFAALGGSTYAATSVGSKSAIHFSKAHLRNGWQSGHKTNPLDAPPGYAKDSLGVVHLRGDIFGGSNDTTAFVLPRGLRPSHVVYKPIYTAAGVIGYVLIQPNGKVLPFGGNVNAFASLGGASFVAGE
jgi:hypothetical protein